jgi:phosphatidylserine/phosphatidylglycerophosphate/cardiolipin synthase-like enzyme
MHAKCVVVDGHRVFVSSANFTEAAQERNVEIGILFESAGAAARINRFFAALAESGQFRRAL